MHAKSLVTLALLLTVSTVLLRAQEKETARGATEHKILTAAELKWQDGPASLPVGVQMVVLDGDPKKEGPFTIRLKMPAGYRIPPHTHPAAAERITVISGTVHLGIGPRFEETTGRELKAGDFAVIPARVPHFAWTRGEAVLQIHSEGPFQRDFVEANGAR